MDKLPNEILDNIFDFLRDDKKILKDLRLVCSKFNNFSARLILKTLVVYEHLSS